MRHTTTYIHCIHELSHSSKLKDVEINFFIMNFLCYWELVYNSTIFLIHPLWQFKYLVGKYNWNYFQIIKFSHFVTVQTFFAGHAVTNWKCFPSRNGTCNTAALRMSSIPHPQPTNQHLFFHKISKLQHYNVPMT